MAGTSNSGGNGGNDAFVAKLRTEGKEVLTLRAALDAFNAQEFPYIRYVGTPGDDTAAALPSMNKDMHIWWDEPNKTITTHSLRRWTRQTGT